MFAKDPLDWMDWNKETQTFGEWPRAKAEKPESVGSTAPTPVRPTPAPAATTPTPQPGPLPARKLTLAERDEEERQYYHFKVDKIRDDAEGTTYRVNKTWIAAYVEAHEDLVILLQLFYDVAFLIFSNRLSTTEYMNTIYNKVITIEDKYSYRLNQTVIDCYSSRHILSLGVSVKERNQIDWSNQDDNAAWGTILKKTNWAAAELNKLRKTHMSLEDYTTAKQVEYLALDMRKALLRPPADRKHALDELANSFRVDTRSKLGRPLRWLGFPVNPPQGSTAYFRKENGAWVLWIGKNEEETCTKVSSLPPWTEGSY